MDRGLIDSTQNFGGRLKAAREGAGFDLETLARRLHIRCDIISAIENADFKNMPASGYAKNMIRSYARTVGLNQNEICDMYLSDLASFERADVRDAASMQIPTNQRRSRRSSFLDLDSSKDDSEPEILSDRIPRRTQAQRSQSRSERQLRESRSKRQSRGYFSNAGTRKHVKTKSMQSTYSLGGAPRPSIPNFDFDFQKLIVPGIVVIIIVLLLIIFNLAFGNKNADVQDDVPAMPISGLTDTSNKDETPATDTSATTVKDHATFKVEVSSGSESWCTVTLDGTQTFADVISGPDSKTFDVKGTLEFTTANSTPVKVYIDDKEQTMTANTSTGMYTFSYTFEATTANKTS